MDWKDFFETLAINNAMQAIMLYLSGKTPDVLAKVKAPLLHVADGIYFAFGLTPPAHE